MEDQFSARLKRVNYHEIQRLASETEDQCLVRLEQLSLNKAQYRGTV
jgi:hypothetical protein